MLKEKQGVWSCANREGCKTGQIENYVQIHTDTFPAEQWLSLLDYPLHLCWPRSGTQALVLRVLGCPGVSWGGHGALADTATDHNHLNCFPILTPGGSQSAASLGHSGTSSWRWWITIWAQSVTLSWNMNLTKTTAPNVLPSVTCPVDAVQKCGGTVLQRFHHAWKTTDIFFCFLFYWEVHGVVSVAHSHFPLPSLSLDLTWRIPKKKNGGKTATTGVKKRVGQAVEQVSGRKLALQHPNCLVFRYTHTFNYFK